MKRFVFLAIFVLIPSYAKAQVPIAVTNSDFEDFQLPNGASFRVPFFEAPTDPFATSAPLIAGLNEDGELVFENQAVDEEAFGWDIIMDEPIGPYVDLVDAPVLDPNSSYNPGEADGQVGGIYLEVENPDVPNTPVGLRQTLTETLQPNRSYALSVDVGNIQSAGDWNFNGFPGYAVVVRAGDEIMTPDFEVAPIPASGTFDTYMLMFDTDATTPGLGEQLSIELWNLNAEHVDANIENYDPSLEGNGIRANEVNFDNVTFEYQEIRRPVPPVRPRYVINPLIEPLPTDYTTEYPSKPKPVVRRRFKRSGR